MSLTFRRANLRQVITKRRRRPERVRRTRPGAARGPGEGWFRAPHIYTILERISTLRHLPRTWDTCRVGVCSREPCSSEEEGAFSTARRGHHFIPRITRGAGVIPVTYTHSLHSATLTVRLGLTNALVQSTSKLFSTAIFFIEWFGDESKH